MSQAEPLAETGPSGEDATARMLAAARAGDGAAFSRLVEPLRDELRAHCYRMLGSFHDAEDAVQDTMDRAWRAVDRFEGHMSIRPWLYRIATNRALSLLGARGRRELPTDFTAESMSRAEVSWLEPYPDRLAVRSVESDPETRAIARETMELAFVAALQHLPPRQRAVLLLRDVLGYSAEETAGMLVTTVAAVNSAMQRARRIVAGLTPSGSQRRILAELGDAGQREVARRYAAAWESGDVETIVAMLTEDARYSMPPLTVWYEGHEQLRGFLAEVTAGRRWRFLPTSANGQLAFGTYLWNDAAAAYLPAGLDLLVLRGHRVAEVVSFLDARLPAFDLPDRLPESSRGGDELAVRPGL
ncbi:RNA polymerase sigma-70 factor (ECF subfamily) [Micromonospora echinospora]|uniref:RNA polymerase sigma-70 factor (ECF subfamily) n=2 Tax=Micromonospora echinospora TaxID=1877 RepID=A0ABR6MJL3_MICEC|nr:RNA polymerase sigma-70 factor (ECF subfamily) [Micromonospora echinospora]